MASTLHILDHRLGNAGGDPPERPWFPPVVEAAMRQIDDKLTGDIAVDLAAVRDAAEPVNVDGEIVDAAAVAKATLDHEAALAEWSTARAAWRPDPAPHVFRVAYWVDCPAELQARLPVTVFIPSRSSSVSGGKYTSVVEGAPCAGCKNRIEPLTHVADATDEQKAAIASGAVVEFVVDEAGGQIPDDWSEDQIFEQMMTIADEIEASLEQQTDHAQTPQAKLIGRAFARGVG